MALAGALHAHSACRVSSRPSTSTPPCLVLASCPPRTNCARAFASRSVCCFGPPRALAQAVGRGRHGLFRVRVQAEAESEVVEVKEKEKVAEEDEIDFDEMVHTSLPPELMELTKDAGTPPNYWLIAFGLTAAIITRKAIWAELKRWTKLAGKLAVLAGLVVVDLVIFLTAQLIKLGGDPLISVVTPLISWAIYLHGWLRFIAKATPILPIMYAVLLSSVVLLVGESVSNTYGSTKDQFPNRMVFDLAFLLGVGAFVGLVPVVVFLGGLAAVTTSLLAVRRINPVAGFTPAASVLVAVTRPIIRYPILVSFIGSSLYRFWKLGYLSPGAVQKEKSAEYPWVLAGLIYLAAFAAFLRTSFYGVDFTRSAIAFIRS